MSQNDPQPRLQQILLFSTHTLRNYTFFLLILSLSTHCYRNKEGIWISTRLTIHFCIQSFQLQMKKQISHPTYQGNTTISWGSVVPDTECVQSEIEIVLLWWRMLIRQPRVTKDIWKSHFHRINEFHKRRKDILRIKRREMWYEMETKCFLKTSLVLHFTSCKMKSLGEVHIQIYWPSFCPRVLLLQHAVHLWNSVAPEMVSTATCIGTNRDSRRVWKIFL